MKVLKRLEWMRKVRIGLVGGGTIHNWHMLAYRKLPEVEVIAVCALPKDVKSFAKKWEISKTYTKMERICKDPDIDVIDVGCPNYLHSKAAVLAAEEDKAVLCEKPMAMNAEKAKEMVKAVEKHGVFNAYLENYTFRPDMEEAKRCVENGAIGKPVWMSYVQGSRGPYSPWFFKPEQSGGGCLIDLGVHGIEVHRWILGMKTPIKVFGWKDSLVNKEAIEGGIEDHNTAIVKYDDVMSECQTCWGDVSGGPGIRVDIHGTEGTISTGSFPTMKVYSVAQREGAEPIMKTAGFKEDRGWFLYRDLRGLSICMDPQMEHIVRCYREDKTPRETFRDGLVVNKIMDAVYKSADSGKWENVAL